MNTRHRAKPVAEPCPCGLGADYAHCCAPYHQGEPAPTPEKLMRSRYTAYVYGLADYLLATWATETRPENLDLAEGGGGCKWLGLEVKACTPPTPRPEGGHTATVSFVARYRVGGRAYRLAELSRFREEQGRWFYVDGDIG